MENKNLEETDVNEKQKARNGKSAMPMRTCLVMILAGVYVAYLGVSLCQNVINGAEGSSPGFMVAGVIFIVLIRTRQSRLHVLHIHMLICIQSFLHHLRQVQEHLISAMLRLDSSLT